MLAPIKIFKIADKRTLIRFLFCFEALTTERIITVRHRITRVSTMISPREMGMMPVALLRAWLKGLYMALVYILSTADGEEEEKYARAHPKGRRSISMYLLIFLDSLTVFPSFKYVI